MLTIEELSVFCKKKGIVFPTAEIYGGLSGFFDYGPIGVELKNNIKQHWWRRFVKQREDVVGIDGAIITNPKVWQASGHVECFEDILVEDTKTKERYRADQLVEDALKIRADSLNAEDLWKLIEENKIDSPKGNPLSKPRQFNLMFRTHVGPAESDTSTSYLRPETAQLIFTNFKLVQETARMKLPFGIAQIGKAFRNEISPRDFLFRSREFEQMEIEYFFDGEKESAPKAEATFLFLSREAQKKSQKASQISVSQLKRLSKLHAYWLVQAYQWYVDIGINSKKLRIREHTEDELSHYASATFDIEYEFPIGWKEIHGSAHRGTFDLSQHEKSAKVQLRSFDEESKTNILPTVIEPSWGVDRALLAVLCDAFDDDKKRGNIVLKIHPSIAPIQVGVFPLVKNKPDVVKVAQKVAEKLRMFTLQYDESGSIGRRYARADELGIPLCVTIDFQSLDDNAVTIRNRDTTEQVRVKIDELTEKITGIFEKWKA